MDLFLFEMILRFHWDWLWWAGVSGPLCCSGFCLFENYELSFCLALLVDRGVCHDQVSFWYDQAGVVKGKDGVGGDKDEVRCDQHGDDMTKTAFETVAVWSVAIMSLSYRVRMFDCPPLPF